jgi:hypothetical protein
MSINSFIGLQNRDDSFSTDSPQKLWKIQKACQAFIVLSLLVALLFVSACSQGKGVEKFKALPRGTTLIGKTETEVKQAIGEPYEISLTPENRILWKYRPSWKIIPSPKDTLYVEFDNGKVAKVFQIK